MHGGFENFVCIDAYKWNIFFYTKKNRFMHVISEENNIDYEF